MVTRPSMMRSYIQTAVEIPRLKDHPEMFEPYFPIFVRYQPQKLLNGTRNFRSHDPYHVPSYGNQYIQTLSYKDIPLLSRFYNNHRSYILHRKQNYLMAC